MPRIVKKPESQNTASNPVSMEKMDQAKARFLRRKEHRESDAGINGNGGTS